MEEQSQWVSNYSNQSLLQGIHTAIRQHVTQHYGSQIADEIEQTIQTTQTQLEQHHASWVIDEASTFHLRLMSLLLASYRALSDIMAEGEALLLLKDATIEPSRKAIRESTKRALDDASNPMAVLVDVSKQLESDFFGQSFTFERYQDDQQAYILHVKRCFYHEFTVANKVPELMQILCESDWVWASAIEPAQHGFSFELPTTLGYGGDMCRFCFRQLTK